jgi:hypothetical protein
MTLTATNKETKRFNLLLPQVLFDELEAVAERRHTSVVELLRRFIKLGLIADQIEMSPDAELIIREGDVERRILLI